MTAGSPDAGSKLGLALSSEEHGPNELIELAIRAEALGFDFVSISDHFHPWLPVQGHSPFVWGVLGGIAARTSTIEVGIGVTCPILRMHPAIVAHAAATAGCMLPERFTFGVGTGEALNEHVTGQAWPPADIRLDMLAEAITVMRRLWRGGSVTHRGRYYTVENATLYDRPDTAFPLLVSAFGEHAARLAAEAGDGLWLTGTGGESLDHWRATGGSGPVWSQLTFAWDPDEETARRRAAQLWANTAVVGQVAQDLPTTAHFEWATGHVDASNIAGQMACGPDPEPIVESVHAAVDAGVSHVYLHQVDHDLDPFLGFWDQELRELLT